MKTIFSSVIQARRLLLFVLLFVVSLLGGFVAIACDSADYTVVKSAKSPDGNLSALLCRGALTVLCPQMFTMSL